MQNKETKSGGNLLQGDYITVGTAMILLVGIALSLLLLTIGTGTRVRWLTLVGDFLFPVSLFTAGLLWGKEHLAVRITFMALAGLFVIAVFGSISPL